MTDHTERMAAEMADAAERGELTPTGPALTVQEARAQAAALLMAATGARTREGVGWLALGRPRVGEER